VSTYSASLLAKIATALVNEHDGDDLDRDDAKKAAASVRDLGFRADGVEIDISGYGDWIVSRDGTELAEERVAQDLEEEPELFTPSWIRRFYSMSSLDRRIYAQEDADSAAEGMDADDLSDEIGEIRAVKDAEEALEEAEDDLEDALDDDDDDAIEDAESAVDDAEAKLARARLDAVDEAREAWAENYAEEIEADLERDALGYFTERFGPDGIPDNLLTLDIDAAADNAVSADGAGHFLSSYDGNETYVTVEGEDFYCYRTN